MRLQPIWERIIGKHSELSMENRAYNLANVISLIVLTVFFLVDFTLQIYVASTILITILLMQGFFYYQARFLQRYQFAIIWNAIFSYIALIVNYFYDAGIDGPTIFVSFLTFHFLITVSKKKQGNIWLAMHIGITATLLAIGYFYPSSIQYNYHSAEERLLDVFISYIATLLFIYFLTVFLRQLYDHEKATAAATRKAIEEQAQQVEDSGNILRSFFDSSGSSHILLGKNFEVLAYNKLAEEYMQQMYKRQIKSHENIIEYVPVERVQEFTNKIVSVLYGTPIEEERSFTYKDGSISWWYISYNPASDADGNIIGVSINAIDITTRKLQEEKIREKNARLMKIAQIQSHEYRGPVASILGMMQVIKEEDYNATKEYLLLLEQAVKDLDDQIHKAVDYTKDL